MNTLSEVTLLFSEHVRAIERAREIFTSEIRNFARGVVDSVRQRRTEPWTTNRLRISIERDIDHEAKVTGYVASQFAVGRATVRFKKETRFVSIADVTFGIGWSDESNAFMWFVHVVPGARYPHLDDVLWREWQAESPRIDLPGSEHQSKSNQLRLCARPLDRALVGNHAARDDVVQVLEFILRCDNAISEAVGLNLTQDEEASATPVTSAD